MPTTKPFLTSPSTSQTSCRPGCWSRCSNAQLPYTTPRWQRRRRRLPKPAQRPSEPPVLTPGQTPPPSSCQGQTHLPATVDAASASRRSWEPQRARALQQLVVTGTLLLGARSLRARTPPVLRAGAALPGALGRRRGTPAPEKPVPGTGHPQRHTSTDAAAACPPRFRKAPEAVERKRVKNPSISAEPPQTRRPSRHQARPGGATTAVWTPDTTRGHQRSGTNQAAG